MKVYCTRHQEKTPSVEVYPDHGYCFGCGATIPLSELGGNVAEIVPQERYKEDLEQRRRYVDALPKKEFRGFVFPYDEFGFYICWPDSSYYKLRLHDPVPKGKSKYKCPSGHKQPVLWTRRAASRTLVLSEGEINALSVAEAFPEWDVMSPGSASDFKTDKFKKYILTIVRYYRTVVIQTDRDGAGTEAAIHTKGFLLNKAPNIHIVLMERDSNEIYCDEGKEKLREEVLRHLPPVQ